MEAEMRKKIEERRARFKFDNQESEKINNRKSRFNDALNKTTNPTFKRPKIQVTTETQVFF